MPKEIELKLDLSVEAVAALDAAAFWPGEPVVADQRSIYFDTPDHDLAKAGMSLRIRRSGRKRVQTIKAEGASAGALFVRSEWERRVGNDTPILDATTPIAALLGGKVDAVAPVFEVQVERRSWLVEQDGARLELVLDRGEIVAGDRRAPICEIELELKSGRAATLFAFARTINATAPARLGVQSKAERGGRLLGPAPTTVKAEPLVLANDVTAAEAFRLVVQNCLRHYRLNEAVLLARREPVALHQARVALRRLRSAFSIFKPVVAGRHGARLRDELRWLTAELGLARNLDVLLEGSPVALRDRLAAAREAAYDRVQEVLASARVRMLMIDLVDWTVAGEWLDAFDHESVRSQPAVDLARKRLDRLRREVRKSGRDVVHVSEGDRHELRKSAKKLRYGAEFFSALFEAPRERRRRRRFVGSLGALQDELGALNDMATASEVLERLGISDDPDARQLLAGRKRKSLLAAAVEAYDDLIDAKAFWR